MTRRREAREVMLSRLAWLPGFNTAPSAASLRFNHPASGVFLRQYSWPGFSAGNHFVFGTAQGLGCK